MKHIFFSLVIISIGYTSGSESPKKNGPRQRIFSKRMAMIESILEKKLAVNDPLPPAYPGDDQDGEAPLLYVAPFDWCNTTVQNLLAHGADPLIRTKEGRNAFYIAAAAGADANLSSLIQSLFEKDRACFIDIPNDSQLTPLHAAARESNFDCLKMLLAHGADPNTPDRYNNRPLHLAACNITKGSDRRIKRIIIELIRAGADPLLKNSNGETALELLQSLQEGSLYKGHRRVAQFLAVLATPEVVLQYQAIQEYRKEKRGTTFCHLLPREIIVELGALISKGHLDHLKPYDYDLINSLYAYK